MPLRGGATVIATASTPPFNTILLKGMDPNTGYAVFVECGSQSGPPSPRSNVAKLRGCGPPPP